MALLSPVASNVKLVSGRQDTLVCGEAIVPGQLFQARDVSGVRKAMLCNSSDADQSVVTYLALASSHADDGYIVGAIPGSVIDLGAILVVSTSLWLHSTTGGLSDSEADVTAGGFPCFVGMARSTSELLFEPLATRIAK